MRLVLALLCIMASLSTALAAEVEECEAAAQKLVTNNGAVIKNSSGRSRLLIHPDATDILFRCSENYKSPDVNISIESGNPSERFYSILGLSAQYLLQAPPIDSVSGARACQLKALRSKTEMAEVVARGLRIECHSFTRDGGGTIHTIFRAQDER